MNLGERIKQLRDQKGWNPADLASQAGVSSTTIKNIEDRPDQNPTLDNLRRIASALEVSVAYLIGEGYPVPENLRLLAIKNGILYKDLDPLLLMNIENKEGTTEEEWGHLLSSTKAFPALYKRLGRVRGNGEANSH
jgi:transcriptional regulator with XRE-family HTH domain